MAKKSKIAKNNRRKVLAERYKERRAELIAVIKSPEATYEQKREEFAGLVEGLPPGLTQILLHPADRTKASRN